ncbi:MAG: tetratricopeptide repeat protein [Anaerolineae bacterium]|nr:tetratricopeptide repeat protein [Anaerolineae bacterium]
MSDQDQLSRIPLDRLLQEAFHAFDNDRLDEAETLYRHCLHRLKDSDDTDTYHHALHMLAFVRSHQGDFDEARQIYQQLLDAARQREDQQAISINLHQLGMVERLAGQYIQAQQLFETEFQHLKTHLPDFNLGLSANAYERAYARLLQGDVVSAESVMMEALDYAEAGQDPVCKACALRGMGEIHLARQNKQQAQDYFAQSAAAFRMVGDDKAALQVEQMSIATTE